MPKKRTSKKLPTSRSVDLKAIQPIARQVNLEGVETISFSAETTRPLGDLRPHQLDQRVGVKGMLAGTNDTLAAVNVVVQYSAALHGEVVAKTSLSIMLTYVLRDDRNWESLPADAVDQFAEVNGVYNAWPFVRESVMSFVSRLGLSGVLLPLWTPPTELPPKGEFAYLDLPASETDLPE